MQRSTARFLLFLALVGTFLPLALAATVAPARACCLRAAHHCHSISESEQRTVSGIGSCSHNCCRGVTTSQAARPKPPVAVIAHEFAAARSAESDPAAPLTNFFSFAPTRAPPTTSIA